MAGHVATPGPVPHCNAAMIALQHTHTRSHTHSRGRGAAGATSAGEDRGAGAGSGVAGEATVFQTLGGSYQAVNQSAWTTSTPRTSIQACIF